MRDDTAVFAILERKERRGVRVFQLVENVGKFGILGRAVASTMSQKAAVFGGGALALKSDRSRAARYALPRTNGALHRFKQCVLADTLQPSEHESVVDLLGGTLHAMSAHVARGRTADADRVVDQTARALGIVIPVARAEGVIE